MFLEIFYVRNWYLMLVQEMFEGIRTWNVIDCELVKYLEEKDIEYLEAACLLHKIGLFSGKKGYHKQSYQLIMVSDSISF